MILWEQSKSVQDGTTVTEVLMNARTVQSQVSCLALLDPRLLADVEREFAQTTVPWSENYSEFQSSGWWTVSLLNDTGHASDTTIHDGVSRETDLLKTMPFTKQLLRSLKLEIFWARAALLEPHSFLWEHVDYTEFVDEFRLRLHIPITTNDRARLVLQNVSIQMTPGYLWKLNPREIHGAANLGHTTRIHLILDCHLTDELRKLMSNETLPIGVIEPLPGIDDTSLNEIISRAGRLAMMGYHRAAQHLVLSLYHAYSLPQWFTITQLIRLYKQLGMVDHELLWTHRATQLMGVRNE